MIELFNTHKKWYPLSVASCSCRIILIPAFVCDKSSPWSNRFLVIAVFRLLSITKIDGDGGGGNGDFVVNAFAVDVAVAGGFGFRRLPPIFTTPSDLPDAPNPPNWSLVWIYFWSSWTYFPSFDGRYLYNWNTNTMYFQYQFQIVLVFVERKKDARQKTSINLSYLPSLPPGRYRPSLWAPTKPDATHTINIVCINRKAWKITKICQKKLCNVYNKRNRKNKSLKWLTIAAKLRKTVWLHFSSAIALVLESSRIFYMTPL